MTEPAPARFNLARYCLAEQARAHPDRIAVTIVGDAGETSWTYGALDRDVRALAAGLRGLGLPPGARVMIRMGNEAGAVLSYFAAIAAGYVALLASAQLTEEEAGFLLADCGAGALVLGREFEGEAHVGAFAVLRGDDLTRLLAHDPIDYADTGADDPAYLVYTSGTTSRPKGVLHAHRAAWGRRPMYAHWQGLGPSDVVLHAGAMNWTYTLGVGVVDPLANGATALLYNGRPDPSAWPRLIERHRATIFAAVPGVYRQILKYAALASHDLRSLRHGLTAGAALSPSLLEEWRARVGTELYEAFGMSEISTFVSSGPTTPVRPGSPGRPQPGRRVAVLPRDGGTEPLGVGETGVLAVRRGEPGLMLRYWNRPDEERLSFRGDWFVSGDLVEIDAESYVWHHGRADEVMNALGYRVSPAEVEKCLAAHPLVAEAAVAERPGRDDQTIIKAYVVARDGETLSEEAILAHCAQHLAAYKRPRVVVFLEALPRNRNGKLLRAALP
ncbi:MULTISPECIES: acyl-CoA synthetase [Methylosinus]|uniref:AMP-dependent synthetase n=1 Tax=Methylosinus trichosporium (strain ATCC 35070 / NCIMB 11131 / UNIQEM 75 / OB3b) TaxID=595536 RepID=A0A2D2CXU9_METT3|nr:MULTISPECIES: acyl-CoA synthetase [Methylosinus]ATQ67536.1 AMP-dependent synthetase [Methylosinus trichosporium OB3b]OBS50819.1 AMP-dependent synthetase [Methylosinus sp. 3S-1]